MVNAVFRVENALEQSAFQSKGVSLARRAVITVAIEIGNALSDVFEPEGGSWR